MPDIKTTKTYYDALTNDNVQFLQGTQADLNKYLPGSGDTNSGKAVEGAFYLTTDTHRLYIGRKAITPQSGSLPSGIVAGKVYPEEVSTGIATVQDTGSLNQVAISGEAHYGDFYYIEEGNILAVYEKDSSGNGHWVQINAHTNVTLDTLSQTVAAVDNNKNIKITTSAGTTDQTTNASAYFTLKAGANVTLTRDNDSSFTISSANSQSTLKVSDNAVAASTNSAPVILTDGVNTDTSVYFSGINDTTVESKVENNQNKIIIAGPGIKGTKATARGTAGATSGNSGFEFAIEVQDGNKAATRDAKLNSNGSVFDPIIKIGENKNVSTKFYGGEAQLDVYTTSEVDDKIASNIITALQDVDALHYKGTVSGTSSLPTKGVCVGDVYKASAAFSYSGTAIKVGDLFIAKGTESYHVSGDTTVVANKIYYTRSGSGTTADPYVYTKITAPTGNPSTSNYYEYSIANNGITWEIIPSGDEPFLEGKIVNTGAGGAGPSFGLEDKNISANYDSSANLATRLAKRPLYVSYDNSNSNLIEARSTGDSADLMKITLHHKAPVSDASTNVTSVTSSTVKAASGTDSLSTKDQVATFTALKTLTRDPYGHIIDVAGETITLKHNYVDEITATHSVTSNVGTVTIGANDALGISNNTTKGSVKLGSTSLNISATGNTQLNIDLKWGSF